MRVLFYLSIFTAFSCAVYQPDPSSNFLLGNFLVNIQSQNALSAKVVIRHADNHSFIEWSSFFDQNHCFIAVAGGTFSAREHYGNFDIQYEPVEERTVGQTVDNIFSDCFSGQCQSVTLSGSLLSSKGLIVAQYTFRLSVTTPSDSLAFDVSININKNTSKVMNRVFINWEAFEEQFYGFGEQYTVHGLRYRIVPVIATEQGVGRGQEPTTNMVNEIDFPYHNAGGSWNTTYTAIPYYITSSMRSVFVQDYRYMTVDLCRTTESLVEMMIITNADGSSLSWTVSGRILHGNTPKDLLFQYTEHTGRMTKFPSWVLKGGAVVGWEGGTDEVRSFWEELRAANVSVAALWLQDWTGLREDSFGSRLWWNWEIDDEWYPEWDEFVAELASAGTRMTTFLNPYLSNSISAEKANFKRDLWKEAASLGYLVRNSTGEPYIQNCASETFTFSAVDLTNPAARQWLKRVIRCNMLGDQSGCDGDTKAVIGKHSGFMADLGEFLPFDSFLYHGDAASVHNLYPMLWAQTLREALQEAGVEGDVVFWSRSASAFSPQYSTLYWTGDQNTCWDIYDGMKSALRGILSGGLSGMTLTHSDIGGYMSGFLGTRFEVTRTRELLQRWIELETFTGTMFRTHPGNHPDQVMQINDDPELLQHFADFSRIHASLSSYRTILIQEAAKKGLPLARYMFLEHPTDRHCWELDSQFMLGQDMVIVPVLDPNDTRVDVYLPGPMVWKQLWTGEEYVVEKGPGFMWLDVYAPIGQPAVFVRGELPPTSEQALSEVFQTIQEIQKSKQ